MNLTGKIRGNGKQLAWYLLDQGENERVWILDVDGRDNANPADLRDTIASMGLMAELTKTNKGYFHAQISPAYGEDKNMSAEQWKQAGDILADQLGYQNQRRVTVMHEKKGRLHAHVVFERYNYQTGKMIDNKHSRLKMNDARQVMEKVFGHKPTPRRNTNKKALKEIATKLWNSTTTGADFLKAVRKAGYMVAEGIADRPYMIVDKTGRSFNLVRQLDKVRTKEVRARLRDEPLIGEKEAIELMRKQNATTDDKGKEATKNKPQFAQAASAFADNRKDAVRPDENDILKKKQDAAFKEFKEDSKNVTAQPGKDNNPSQERERENAKQEAAKQFAENKQSGIDKEATERDKKKQQLIEQQKRYYKRTRNIKRTR